MFGRLLRTSTNADVFLLIVLFSSVVVSSTTSQSFHILTNNQQDLLDSMTRLLPLLSVWLLGLTCPGAVAFVPSSAELAQPWLLLEPLGTSYSYCLDHYHVATQSLTGGFFGGAGDALAQRLDHNKNANSNTYEYNAVRGLQYFAKGLGGGILWSAWYDAADDVSAHVLASLSLSDTAASRIAMDICLEQVLVAPVFYALWDIPVPALLSGSPLRQIPAQVRAKWGPLLAANAVVWTPANLAVYSCPPAARLLVSSCADLIWQTVCSAMTAKEIVVSDVVPTVVSQGVLDESSSAMAPASLSRARRRRQAQETA